MSLCAIAYVSEASPGLSIDHVDDLSRDAFVFNRQAGVTGILLYDGARFMQYIEGPEDSIHIVYSRIVRATSHHEMVLLARGDVISRRFPYWSMRLLPAEPSEVRDISMGDWTVFSRRGAVNRLNEVVAPHLP